MKKMKMKMLLQEYLCERGDRLGLATSCLVVWFSQGW